MINRRKVLSTLVAAPIVLALPNRACARTRNPIDFGTVGAGDDTAAINACAAAIRQDFGGVLLLDGAKTGGGWQSYYDVGPLNFTQMYRTAVRVDAGIVVRGSLMTPTNQAAIFDFTQSHEWHLDCDGAIYGGLGDPYNPSPASTSPLSGVLAGGGGDKILLTSPKITGWFKSGCFVAVSGFGIKFDGYSQLIQRYGPDPAFGGYSPPALSLTGNPGEWGNRSIFAPIVTNGVCADFLMSGGEVHVINGAGPGWTVYMRDTYAWAFDRVNFSSGNTAHFLWQGTCSDGAFVEPKFYTEVPPVPQHVFEAQTAAALSVKMIGALPPVLQSACSGAPAVGNINVVMY